MLRRPHTALAGLLMLLAAPAGGQPGEHAHDHDPPLGAVTFPVSCNAASQDHFTRAVAWLHSFEYEEAELAFRQSAEADPGCAMSHWGVAMSHYHQIWAPPTPAELEAGSRAAAEAARLGGRNPRERDYIAAIQAFYAGAGEIDHRRRTFAYEAAMERLHQRHPADREAAVFHALALIAAGMIDEDETFAREHRAATLLDQVLAAEPDHPGVAHYLIHAYDFPPLAHLAGDAARRYARIAPASAHAQHMPSHIFIRLGLWEEAIRSNLAADAAARAFATRNGLADTWDERLHAMDYLVYAYLQSGQDEQAGRVLDELARITRVDPPSFKVAYAYAAIPARIALERRQWDRAATLALPTNGQRVVEWDRFNWATANIHFARAVGAARSGNVELARREVAALQAIRETLTEPVGNYDWGTQVEIQRRVAAAWSAAAAGESEQALQLMRAAAELDDATEKHPVMPGPILPAREQLAELLLQLERPQEALQAFERTLARAPRRFNALAGAAAAARRAGDNAQAARFYRALVEQSSAASSRSELVEARAQIAALQR